MTSLENGGAQALVNTMSIFMHLVTLNKESLFVLSSSNVVKELFPKFYIFRLGKKICQIFIERNETQATIVMQPKTKMTSIFYINGFHSSLHLFKYVGVT